MLWQMMSTIWCMLQSEVSSDCTVSGIADATVSAGSLNES